MTSKTADLYIRFVLWGLAGNCLVLVGSIFIESARAAHLTRVTVLAMTVFLSIFLVVLSFQAETHSPSLDAEGRYKADARLGRSHSSGNIIASVSTVAVKFLLGIFQSLWRLGRSIVSPNRRQNFPSDQVRAQAGFFGEIASSAEENTQVRRPFLQEPAAAGRSKEQAFGFPNQAVPQAPPPPAIDPQAVFNPPQQGRRADQDSRRP